MSLTNWIILSIATAVTLFIQICIYGEISNKKIKISICNILLILFCGIVITQNTYHNSSILRACLSFSILLVAELLIFKDGFRNTLVKGALTYIISIFSEVFFDIILIFTNVIDLKSIDSNIFLKVLISIIIVVVPYFVLKIKIIKRIVKSIVKSTEKTIIPAVIILLFLISTIIIAFKNISYLSPINYIGNIILFVVLSILILIILHNERKIEKEVENTRILLDFMADYEKKIDEDRLSRHELLNNLLLLKSYKNKNSKEYNDTLDNLINIYNKKSIGIKNIYKLPSGLKGIIYYKMNEVNDKNIKFNINISKQLTNNIELLDNKTYTTLCKIVSIIFDNSIEAAVKSKEKNIIVDVYEDNNAIIIDIENTFKGTVNIEKINHKNYSTKGKNRGLGLYIVNNLVKNTSNINLVQEIDKNIFITKIYVKNLDN